MNSVQQQQEENSQHDLNGKKAIEKIQELIKQDNICFFCTHTRMGKTNGARPMSILKADDKGTLWFVSPADSDKNKEIVIDPEVKIYLKASAHSDMMYLCGQAFLHLDKSKIEELWNPFLKVWFTEGKDDTRISIIKFIPEEGYYWDSKSGNFVATIKMVAGAITGTTIDDSVEGKLKL